VVLELLPPVLLDALAEQPLARLVLALLDLLALGLRVLLHVVGLRDGGDAAGDQGEGGQRRRYETETPNHDSTFLPPRSSDSLRRTGTARASAAMLRFR